MTEANNYPPLLVNPDETAVYGRPTGPGNGPIEVIQKVAAPGDTIVRGEDGQWHAGPFPEESLPSSVVNSSTAVFNVKNYGAIGDGSAHPLSGIYGTLGAAQAVYPAVTSLAQELDWAAAQKAIEAATAAKGGVVFFPAGFHQIGTRLTIPVNVPIKLLGAGFGYIGGEGITVLVRPVTGDYLIYAVGSEAEALNENNPAHRIHLEVEEMKLDGGFYPSPAVRLRFGSECYFRHVRFHNAHHNLLWATQLYNTVFEACYFTVGGNGTTNPAVLLDAPTGTLNNGASNTVQFVGCEWESNGGTDLEVTGSENSAIWVNVTNFKMERETGAFPFVHFGHAQGCSLGDGSIHMGTESNETLVVSDGTTLAGDGGVIRPNRISNVQLSSFSEPEYMVSHTHGLLTLTNVGFNATVIKTAFIHVGSEVAAGAFKYAGLTSTNEPRLIYDQSGSRTQELASGDTFSAVATQGANNIGSFISSGLWGSGHVFRDSAYKDGIFYVKEFLDETGKNSGPTTFGQIFGGVYIKKGEGSGQVFWGNVQHHGSGQMGLFIGSIQNTEGDPGGDLFGGDMVLTDNVGANLYGWRIYFSPKTGTSRAGKTSIGIRIGNTNPTNVTLNQALRIEGSAGWENPIIVYSDSGTTPVWDIDGSGNMNLAGNVIPLTGSSKTLGSIGEKWQQLFISTYISVNGGVSAGASGAIGIADNAKAPSGTPSTSGFILYSAGGRAQTMDGAAVFRAVGDLSPYGDGSDGTGTFDGAATPAGTSKSGSTYTLLRDVYYTNATLSNNAIVITTGFRIFCRQTLTIGTECVVKNDGAAGSGSAAGGAIASKTLGGSAAGGAGGVGTTGSNGSGTSSTLGLGAVGGAGGIGTGGGTGGGPTAGSAALSGSLGSPHNFSQALNPCSTQGGAQFVAASGGGGGTALTGSTGGGGGSGAGIVGIYAQYLVNEGTISAKGGAGAAAVIGLGAGAGGGGGGGGGCVILVYASLTAGTITVTGGGGGALAGTGSAGANGSTGTIYEVQT